MHAEKQLVKEIFPLERNGIRLHLERARIEEALPERDLLLVHGVTYSSHEFDVDYLDYSFVRRFAEEGFGVWSLDIAGYGRSGAVEDGFLPDSDYAAEDIAAAAELIAKETGREKTDVLGWSWGTVTAGRFAAGHPGQVGRLVLYAPILCGVGAQEVKEPFHRNTWEHAADDFQRLADGSFDPETADPVVIGLLCSGCWRYDGEYSPNGGRRDICVPETELLIDLAAIKAPTLVICGDRDPYVNYALLGSSQQKLPEGSGLEVISGASHAAILERPYHKELQDRILSFLKR